MQRLLYLFLLFLPILVNAQEFSTYEWEVYDTMNSNLEEIYVVDFLFNDDGSAYVSTNYLGFYHFKEGIITKLPNPDFPHSHWYMDMEYDDEGRILIVGNTGQLVYFHPSTQTWSRRDFPGQGLILEKNHKGTFLITTHIGDRVQLYQFRDDELTPIEIKREDALGLYIAKNGDAYVGYRDGAYKYPMDENGTYTLSPEKLGDISFYDFDLDSRGQLWGTSFTTLHLHRMNSNGWKEYESGPKELYYDWNGNFTYIVHHLMVLPDDRVMISSQATLGVGLYDGRSWESYPVPGAGFGGGARLKLAGDGSIWMATPRHGLVIFRPGEEDSIEPEPIALIPDGDTLDYLPTTGRTVFTADTLRVNTKNITAMVRDHLQVDGDTISLYLNGEPVLLHFPIDNSFKEVPLTLRPGDNELLLYAHNLGKIPPNTIFLRVEAAGISKRFFLNSDLERCERLVIRVAEN